jgi:DnaB-helicase binding domain of primase
MPLDDQTLAFLDLLGQMSDLEVHAVREIQAELEQIADPAERREILRQLARENGVELEGEEARRARLRNAGLDDDDDA